MGLKFRQNRPLAVQDIEHSVAELSIDVGTHLRTVRTMYGLSQRELAKRAGTSGHVEKASRASRPKLP